MRSNFKFNFLSPTEVVASLVAISLCLSRGSLLGDPGVGWHLKLGQLIQESKSPPFSDQLITDASWIYTQWASDLLLYLTCEYFGWLGLHVLTATVLFSTYCLLPKSRGLAGAGAILLTAMLASLQWFTRPVMFSFFCFALILRLLNSRFRWSIPIVFAVWANLHPAFILGLGMLFWSLISQAILRRWDGQLLVLIVLSLLATLCTPYGFSLYVPILELGSSSYFMNLNTEWYSPDFHILQFFPLIVMICILVSRPLKISLFDWGLVLGLTFLTLLQRRYAPFLAIVMVRPLCLYFENVLRWPLLLRFDQRSNRLSLLALLICLVVSATRPESVYKIPSSYPHAEVSYLNEIKAAGRILHTPDWGGFLSWYLYPRQRPSIDDRNVLHGEQAYEDYFRVWGARPGWRDKLNDYKWALLSKGAPLRHALEKSAEWELQTTKGQHLLFKRLQF